MKEENNTLNEEKLVNIGSENRPYYVDYNQFIFEDGLKGEIVIWIYNLIFLVIYILIKVEIQERIILGDYFLMAFLTLSICLSIGSIVNNKNNKLIVFTCDIILNQLGYLMILNTSLLLKTLYNRNYGVIIYISSIAFFSLIFYIRYRTGNEEVLNKIKKESNNSLKNKFFGKGYSNFALLVMVYNTIAKVAFHKNKTLLAIGFLMFVAWALRIVYRYVNALIITSLILSKKIDPEKGE